jgi:cytochrome b involved in lipid metabolism/CDGSH-type Zn-finger protein
MLPLDFLPSGVSPIHTREDSWESSTSNCKYSSCKSREGVVALNGKRNSNKMKIRRSNSTVSKIIHNKEGDMMDNGPRTRLRASDSTIISTVALCTCQQSRNFPYCDNTHKIFNKETNSNTAPLVVAYVEDPICSNCGSKEGRSSGLKNNGSANGSSTIKTPQITIPTALLDQELISDSNPSSESKQVQTERKYKPSSIKDKANRQNVFTKEEVSSHCTKDSLWMIIKDKVYDITEYVPHHPGGERALIKFGGRDGTENVQFHSSRMLEICNSDYFIGYLKKDKQEQSHCIIS